MRACLRGRHAFVQSGTVQYCNRQAWHSCRMRITLSLTSALLLAACLPAARGAAAGH